MRLTIKNELMNFPTHFPTMENPSQKGKSKKNGCAVKRKLNTRFHAMNGRYFHLVCGVALEEALWWKLMSLFFKTLIHLCCHNFPL